jgi:hypothetical protein
LWGILGYVICTVNNQKGVFMSQLAFEAIVCPKSGLTVDCYPPLGSKGIAWKCENKWMFTSYLKEHYPPDEQNDNFMCYSMELRDLEVLDSPIDPEFFSNFIKQRQGSVGILKSLLH